MSAYQALLLEHGLKKKNAFFREGMGKWQKPLAEDVVDTRSTEGLRKKRPAADVGHTGVNTDMFFSPRSPLTLYCLGKRFILEKGLLCICHVSNFSLSKSVKRQLWRGRTLNTTLANSQ